MKKHIKKRIMVIKPDKGHSFWVAKALLNNNCLDSLVTNVYYDKNKINLLTIISKFLPKSIINRLKHRNDTQLTEYIIQVNEFYALLWLFLYNFNIFKRFRDSLERFIINNTHKKAFKFAVKRKVDAIIIATLIDADLINKFKLEHKNIKIIFDQTGLSTKYVKEILNVEYKLYPEYCDAIGFSLPNDDDFNNIVKIYKYVDAVINSGKYAKEIIENDNLVDRKKSFYVDYGIDNSIFYFVDRKQKENSISKLKCIYVGNVTVLKGIPTLLTAFDNLKDLNIELLIIGKHSLSNSFMSKFQNVKFLGHKLREDINHYLNESDVFIFPTLMDGFGMAVMEALAAGLPVICSKSCGVADVILDGKNGYLIEAHSYIDIIENIKKFYYNRAMITEMGNNSLKIVKNYGWDDYYQQYNEILRSIFGK